LGGNLLEAYCFELEKERNWLDPIAHIKIFHDLVLSTICQVNEDTKYVLYLFSKTMRSEKKAKEAVDESQN